ncbi:MAG: YggS family pyridoxal phosphate-dependent enzyme [Oscillatoria princeps RMCB-10]|jgi:pyridoxal phosphate enzyme (YggS family)|nr:YggS family pyridoxal phosphate-dependent enzyme [Oscillatoria princeps RMCB-10]
MSLSIAERIALIRSGLPAHVRLIAVTKQVPSDAIREAYAAGIRDFAESRVQEAEPKQIQLQDLPDIAWHFIGHLQANKAQKALQLFESIHSVDSLKLAQRLDRLAEPLQQKPKVCLQVKILRDPNKHGWTIPDLLADLCALNQCRHLQIQGLMTIPPLGLDESETLAVFEGTWELAQKIREQNWPNIRMQELSMGMSADYHLAVKAGATAVRLGTVLFGERQTSSPP